MKMTRMYEDIEFRPITYFITVESETELAALWCMLFPPIRSVLTLLDAGVSARRILSKNRDEVDHIEKLFADLLALLDEDLDEVMRKGEWKVDLKPINVGDGAGKPAELPKEMERMEK